MKKNWLTFSILPVFSFSLLTLAGCATPSDTGLVTGGVIGGVAGSALTGGSTAGTVAGAVGGAFIGRDAARRNYY